MDTKQLNIKVEAKLNVDEDTEQKLRNFYKALDEVPTELNLDVGLDGNFSGEPLRINIKDMLIESVQNHFRPYHFISPLLNYEQFEEKE